MAKFTRKDFLGALFQDYFRKREGFIVVKSLRPLDHKTSVRYFPNTEILSKEPYSPDQHVFFGVCPRENMRPEKSSIQYVVALWAGLDLGPEGYSGRQTYFFGQAQAAKAIRSFPLPPSIIVESGWGVHLYWLLRDVTPITDVNGLERILGRINSYFQCKTEIGVDSMLRLPETANGKVASHPAQCRIKYINPDFRYELADLDQPIPSAAGPLGKSAVFLHPLADGMPDLGVAAQAEESLVATATQNSGMESRDSVSLPAVAGDESNDVGSPSASGNTFEGAAQRRSPMPSVEPDFEPVPYEPVSPKPKLVHQLQSAEAVGEDALERMAEKLADKIYQKIADRLVDRIVEKVAERIISQP